MAEIRVEYRRVFQVKPYETETITLGFSDSVQHKSFSEVMDIEAAIYKQLAHVGDKLMEERLGNRKETRGGDF